MRDLALLRSPLAARGKGLYESLYLTATDPAGGRALWLRHTWLKRPGEDPRPQLWITWWGPSLLALRGPGTAELGPTSTVGTLDGHVWDLAWQPSAGPLSYLPGPLLDRARSNGAALVPHGTARGTFDSHDLTGWHVVVGHNWGAEHAPAWTWAHGAAGDTWFDLLRVRPFAHLPWLTVATVHVDGTTHRSRRPLDLQLSPREEVHWDYESPTGRPRQVRNCSVADARLTYRGVTHTFTGTAVVEHGA